MINRLAWVMILSLLIASLTGLLLSVSLNLLLFGRPDRSFMQVLGETVEQGLKCEDPTSSPFFQHALSDSDVARLSWYLYDEERKVVIATRAARDQQAPDFYELSVREKEQASWGWIRPEWSGLTRLTPVCEKPWALYAYGHQSPQLFAFLLPRQVVLFSLTTAAMAGAALLFYFYLRYKGREAEAVLRRLAQGDLTVRIPLHRFERFFDLAFEFNRMADKMVSLIEELRVSKQKRAAMIAELAHDLRTPLASVSAAAETLQDFDHQLGPERSKNLLSHMQEDLGYLKRLLDDLLYLAQLDQYEPRQQMRPTPLEPVFERALTRLTEQLRSFDRQRKVTWTLPPEGLPLIQGDADLLQRMMQNLVENAVRYSLSEIKLKIDVHRSELVIRIENNSFPLATEDIAAWGHKRSQRRFHDNPMHPGASLGLGSSIIQQIANLHGGTAQLTVTPWEANEVWVTVEVRLPRSLV